MANNIYTKGANRILKALMCGHCARASIHQARRHTL